MRNNFRQRSSCVSLLGLVLGCSGFRVRLGVYGTSLLVALKFCSCNSFVLYGLDCDYSGSATLINVTMRKKDDCCTLLLFLFLVFLHWLQEQQPPPPPPPPPAPPHRHRHHQRHHVFVVMSSGHQAVSSCGQWVLRFVNTVLDAGFSVCCSVKFCVHIWCTRCQWAFRVTFLVLVASDFSEA